MASPQRGPGVEGVRIYALVFFQSEGLALTQLIVFSAENLTNEFLAKTTQSFASID